MSRYICILIIIFVIIGTGSGLFHFYASKDNFYKKTLKLSSQPLSSNYSKIEKSINKLSKDKQSICKNIFEGLHLQNQKKFNESELLLEKAFLALRLNKNERSNFTLKEELLGARFLNSFLQKKYENLKNDLKMFEHYISDSSSLNLLKCMFFYSQMDFSKSLEFLYNWETMNSSPVNISEKNWLSENLKVLFIPQHLPLLKAHCLLETGELSKGKNQLNIHLDYLLKNRLNWAPEIYEQLLLLLSRYHYLSSKKCSSQKDKIIHYEMMIFYLNKSSQIDKKFIPKIVNAQDLLLIMQELASEMTDLNINVLLSFIEFTEKNYNDLPYNGIIEKIHESNEKENYHNLLIKCLKEMSLTPTIKKFRNQLTKNISDYMRLSLQQLDIRKIRKYFAYLEILEPEISFAQRITISTEDMQKILLCGVSPEQLKTYLSLWTKEAVSTKEQNRLLLSLLEGAKSLWRQGNDDSALNILEIILSMTCSNEEVEKEMLKFIKTAYQQAESIQNISKLCLLDEFVFNHRLPFLRHINSENLANLIADTEYFYIHQEYEKALIYCNWLSKIVPYNENVIRLTGLCLVEQKNYKEALLYLDKLSYEKKDKQVTNALSLCMEELALREL